MENVTNIEQEAMAEVVRHTAVSDWLAIVSYLFGSPTPESIEELKAQSLGDDLRAIAAELDVLDADMAQLADEFDALHAAMAADEDALHVVRREHTRVFNHPKHPVIWPYEGVFTDQMKAAKGLPTSDARLFVNQSAMDAERVYRHNGYKMASMKQPSDAISVELGFMARMHASAAQALIAGDEAALAHCEEVLTQFKADRIDNWVADFFQRCVEECQIDFYTLAARCGTLMLKVL